ncbi:MAG: class I SAM-dependent methyltransferase [Chloroflexota bacterium]
MKKASSDTPYNHFVRELVETHSESHTYEQIMEKAVGSGFSDVVGMLERELLIQYGLKPIHYLIDVGCGSGRLAKPLATYLKGNYLGIDIVPELVEYAQAAVEKPSWRFETAQGLTIPEQDGRADVVCFFSVLTHLTHEESYLYLQEAKRVLKPTGKIVFSYLDFQNPFNWDTFQHNIASAGQDNPLNQFISVDSIKIWAHHLDLQVETLNRAGSIKLEKPLYTKDGRIVAGNQFLGQSVCVLSKQPMPLWRRKLNNAVFRLANRLQRLQI